MKAIRLRTEYLYNPMGIDIAEPRLSWNCEDGVKQTAYQIIATEEERGLLWNSEKVCSSQMVHIPWNGASIKSRDKVVWKVCLWDEEGKQGVTYLKNQGVCFETQYFPNAINEPEFEIATVEKNKRFCSATLFKFIV